MDRTIIVCNTSSMPVAAREASIYTGITLGEYYRQMGLDVLLLADSTSRWAQAMRETSGRLEEIPGEEAFPAYLDSSIKGVYERAGVIRTRNGGSVGSLTMIGTVSPAGGNFEEPVTQSTLSTVKTFLGLLRPRLQALLPGHRPLISWSRYLDPARRELVRRNISPGWARRVKRLIRSAAQGDAVQQMMQVTGEEGVTLEDFVTYQKALFVDMVYLQQDAFDPVDVSMPLDRQKESFELLTRFTERDYRFEDKEQAREFFTRVTNAFKNLNYSERESAPYQSFRDQLEKLADDRR
jgi:V/A-type H+-transporting ATPase subunit A